MTTITTLGTTNLVAGYDGPPIVQEVSVSTESGRLSVILGANGAGKSTLIKAMVGLVPPTSGEVYLDSSNITGMQPHQLVRLGIGYLPQLMNVFDELTVFENLEIGGYILKGKLGDGIDEVVSLFPELKSNLRKRAAHLSGGQQRMLALARTLVVRPRVLLLDEPTAGLSPAYATRVWDQIVAIRDRGVALLVVEQNVKAAMARADTAFVMSNGRLIMSGPATEIATNKDLAALFVG